MSLNVLGIRRFASPDKGLRSKTRAGKMWVEGAVGTKWPRRPKPRSRPQGRRSVYRLLSDVLVFLFFYIFILVSNYFRIVFFVPLL